MKRIMKKPKTILIIPPQWKRKHKIIIKAVFNNKITKEEQEELDLSITKLLFNFWCKVKNIEKFKG